MSPVRRRPSRLSPNVLLTALCLLLGALLRNWIVQVHPPWEAVYSDMSGYVSNADRILKGNLIPESFFQPIGFAGLLAFLRKIGVGYRAIAPIHVCLGTLTAFLAGRIAARVDGERAALLTTFVVSVHFSLAYMSGYYMGETIYAFLLTLSGWIIARSRLRSVGSIVAVSLVLAVSYWLKGYTGPIVGLSLLYFALRFFDSPAQRKLWARNAAILTLLFAMQPALHREVTQRTIGKAQWSPSASGLNMVEGKCPWKHNQDNRGFGWWSPLYVQQKNGTYRKWDHPFTDAAYFQKQALDCIKRDPIVLLESFRNIAELFIRNSLWPSDDYFGKFERKYEKWFLGFLFPGLLVGLFRLGTSQRARRHLFGLSVMVPVVAICAVVYIFKSEIRYRIPFDPFFCLIASSGWLGIAAGTRRAVFALIRRRAPSRDASANRGR